MNNPFTRFLSRPIGDQPLKVFLSQWDRLEAVIVTVFREGEADEALGSEFDEVSSWLQNHYHRYQDRLRPFWAQTTVGGRALQTDPFMTILDVKSAAEVPGNMMVMKLLPAARESLNRLVLDVLEEMEKQ